MKRYGFYILVILGIVFLTVGIWWLLTQSAEWQYGPSFFISIGIFLLVFVAISLRWMHETAAALLGATAVWLVHYIGGTFFPALHIINFEESMSFVDWNVIWLIVGMMIFMAMFSETGAINWIAFRIFRLAKGNAWLLVMGLVILTGVLSAFLNDVTAILLIVPLSIEIAQTVGIHPFAFVIPEVLASNIGGAATIIGDPPSTIVGSHLGLGFVEYLVNMAPIAILCMIPFLNNWDSLPAGDFRCQRAVLAGTGIPIGKRCPYYQFSLTAQSRFSGFIYDDPVFYGRYLWWYPAKRHRFERRGDPDRLGTTRYAPHVA